MYRVVFGISLQVPTCRHCRLFSPISVSSFTVVTEAVSFGHGEK